MTIKPGDKFKTRDGHEVEITRVDEKGTHPVFGRVKVWQQCNWTVDGKWLDGPRDHDMDLSIPPERKSGWLNWYGTDNGTYIYRTRNDAELGALSGRTQVLEIITEDGDPVDVKIHKVTK